MKNFFKHIYDLIRKRHHWNDIKIKRGAPWQFPKADILKDSNLEIELGFLGLIGPNSPISNALKLAASRPENHQLLQQIGVLDQLIYQQLYHIWEKHRSFDVRHDWIKPMTIQSHQNIFNLKKQLKKCINNPKVEMIIQEYFPVWEKIPAIRLSGQQLNQVYLGKRMINVSRHLAIHFRFEDAREAQDFYENKRQQIRIKKDLERYFGSYHYFFYFHYPLNQKKSLKLGHKNVTVGNFIMIKGGRCHHTTYFFLSPVS